MRIQSAVRCPPNVDLRTFVLACQASALDPIRRLGFGDGAHGCLGSEIVLAEIREVVKQLVALEEFSPRGRTDQARSRSASVCRSRLKYGSIHNRLNSGRKRCSLALVVGWRRGRYAKIAPKFGGDSEVVG